MNGKILKRVKTVNANLFKILYAALASISVWALFDRLLASNSGIADKDEGLYLLAASSNSLESAWSFPWQWSSIPIFKLANMNLADFRTLGAVLLFGCSFIFCYQSQILIFTNLNKAVILNKNYIVSSSALIALSIVFNFYAGFVFRTPGYNWVNAIGILISASSFFYILTIQKNGGLKYKNFFSEVTFAFGLFFSVPAKPSTPFFVGCISIWIYFKSSGFKKTQDWFLRITLYFCSIVGLAVLLNIWPKNFGIVFRRALASPTVTRDQELAGAFFNLLKTPKYVYGDLITNPISANVLVLITTVAFILLIMKRSSKISVAFPLVLFSSTLVSGINLSSLIFSEQTYGVDPYKLIYSGAFFLIVAILVVLFFEGKAKFFGNANYLNLRVICFIALLPFVFGFGSARGIIHMSSIFSGPLFLAAYLILILKFQECTLNLFTFWQFSTSIFLMVVIVFQSQMAPYGIKPISENATSLQIGPHGDFINVDKEYSERINVLRRNLVENGWDIGTPILAINFHISSTIPYILGGRPPNSLIISILGNSNSVELARYNLSSRFDPYPYEKSWIISTPINLQKTEQRQDILEIEKLLELRTGRAFPNGYKLIASSEGLEFWKPLD
jgi:hypothetical protein